MPNDQRIPKEARFELQLLVQQEREAAEKLDAVAALLLKPIRERKQALIEQVCAEAGIPSATAEINLQDGTIRTASKKPAPFDPKEN